MEVVKRNGKKFLIMGIRIFRKHLATALDYLRDDELEAIVLTRHGKELYEIKHIKVQKLEVETLDMHR